MNQQELIDHVKTCYALIDTQRMEASVLRNDLDDVRAAYCSLLASYSVALGVPQDAEAIAKSFGWSCYDRSEG